jgi:uncharacterized membrane protein
MGFWIFMFCCNLLLPVIMLAFGFIFTKKPPKQINDFYGYRTAMSRKNMETWTFAHTYCGRLWKRLGLVLLPVSMLVSILSFPLKMDAVGLVGLALTGVQLVVLLVSIIPVERALKINFDEYGRRRNSS